MKFSTREDVAAPMDYVFARLSDFDRFEKAALRRGAEVARTDRLQAPGPGMVWRVAFDWRGRRRQAVVELAEHVEPSRLLFDFTGRAFAGTLAVSMIALSPRRTRVITELDFRPRTMTARLVIQSLRLTRGRQNRRFKERIAAFAREVEGDHDALRGGGASVARGAGRN
jgi:carbon monoxide dehydrogenase subunit G